MKTTHIVVAALIVSAIAANALAHGGATGIVKVRMEAMSKLGKAVKVIAEMVRGKQPYDANAVKSNAMIIKSHSGPAMMKLFPQNSLQKASEARKEIWSNWNEFSELAMRLETLSKGLEIAADNGLSTANASKTEKKRTISNGNSEQSTLATMPVDSIFNKLAKTCATCHEKFRLKKN
jgi:cytochrome c556